VKRLERHAFSDGQIQLQAVHGALAHKLIAGFVNLAIGMSLLVAAPQALAAADEGLERELIRMTNLDRTSNGLGSLLPETTLTGLARERSEDMQTRNYFAHEIPPSGEKVFAEMDRRGWLYEAAGENLGWNSAARDATIQFVQRDFMNSPSHRSNVLKEVFTQIGVGSVPGTGRIMHTVLFLKPMEPRASAPPNPPAPPAAPAEPAEEAEPSEPAEPSDLPIEG